MLNNMTTKGRTLVGVVTSIKDEDTNTAKNNKGKVQVRIPEFHGPKKKSDLPDKLANKGSYWTKDEDLPWISVCYPIGYKPDSGGDLSSIISVDEMVYVSYTDDSYQTPVIVGTTGSAIYGSTLARLASNLDNTGGLANYGAGGTMSIPVTPGEFGDPIAPGYSWTLTSPFGYRTHPISGTVKLHTGIDMGASGGTPILASMEGKVVYAGWYGGYGNFTTIQHNKNGKTFYTSYAHQSSIGVSTGQSVTKQTVIGRVGTTGSSTGNHLHFEIKTQQNSGYENPMNYIKKGVH